MPELLGIAQKSLESFLASGGNDMDAYLISNRSLGVMNSILKELSSIKMPSGLRVTGQVRLICSNAGFHRLIANSMTQLVNDLCQPLQALYSSFSQSQMALLSPTPVFTQQTAGTTHLTHLLYKCLSRMAVWAWGRLCVLQFKELQPWVL